MSLAGSPIEDQLSEEAEATSMAVEEGRQLYQTLWEKYDELVKSPDTQDSARAAWADHHQQEYQSILITILAGAALREILRAEETPEEAPEGQAGQAREDQAEQGPAAPAEQGPEVQGETQSGHD